MKEARSQLSKTLLFMSIDFLEDPGVKSVEKILF